MRKTCCGSHDPVRRVRLALAILFVPLLGCISQERVEGWPVLSVREHCVADVSRHCDPGESACARFFLDRGACEIYMECGTLFDEWVRSHERAHCEGHDHVGSVAMEALLARWRDEQGGASPRQRAGEPAAR